MKGIVLHIVLVLATFVGFANESLIKGNELYSQGKYEEALASYQMIENQGMESEALYYNMANCHFKLNQLGASILYYEKALKIDPDDEDALFNLQMAQLGTVDKIEAIEPFFLRSIYENIVSVFGSGVWAIIGQIFLLLGIGSIVYFIYTNSYQKKRMLFASSILMFLFMTGSFLFANSALYQEENNDFGIVGVDNSYVKSSPDEKGTDVFMLHEGTKVELLDAINGWQRVRIADGKKGWMKQNDIKVI